MKRVSFEVAKAIKEADYPQDYGEGSRYYSEDGRSFEYDSELYPMFPEVFCVCPYAMEVWLWLWREKETPIPVDYSCCGVKINDPEEVIISAIEELVKKNLIK